MVRESERNEDSDDSMPALEYVGTSPQGAREGLRPGDEVLFEGLSRVELNGQTGIILPFTDAEMARKGRLGVRLQSGTKMSLKRDNLRKVKSAESPGSISGGASSSTAAPRKEISKSCEDEDIGSSMPALKKNGGKDKVSLVSISQKTAEVADDASDDSMPPLDFVGSSSKKEAAVADDSDSDMPPLEYVGASSSKKEPVVGNECGSDMPPLQCVSSSSKNGSAVDDESDSDMPPLEYVGPSSQKKTAVADESGSEVPPVACVSASAKQESSVGVSPKQASADDGSDSDMPPLEYVGSPSKKETRLDDGSDSDMPPLEYVGSSSKQASQKESVVIDDSDSDMPPLEHVGPSSKKESSVDDKRGSDMHTLGVGSSSKKDAVGDDNSDSDMPPLEYVGPSCKKESCVEFKRDNDTHPLGVSSSSDKKSAIDDGSDSDMPPLEYVGSSSKQEADVVDESDSDMPPLEYVGKPSQQILSSPSPKAPSQETSRTVSDDPMPLQSAREEARPGDEVILEGLTKVELNGKKGLVLHSVGSQMASKGRLPVMLESGQKLSLKQENLRKVSSKRNDHASRAKGVEPLGSVSRDDSSSTIAPRKTDDGSSMLASTTNGAEVADDASDDSMPPLDFVGSSSKKEAAVADDSDSDMPPLEYVGPSSKKESVVVNASASDMPPLQCVGSSKKESAVDDGSDSDMPPLEYVGPPPQKKTVVDDESDSDMPPLEYVGPSGKTKAVSEPPGGASSKQGSGNVDKSGSDKPPLGCVGSSSKQTTAVGVDDSDSDMPPLEYVGSSQKKESVVDDGSDSDMPPLEYVGTPSHKSTAALPSTVAPKVSQIASVSKASFEVGDHVVLKGLTKKELNGQTGVVESANHKQDMKDTTRPRVPVLMNSSKQRLLIKAENLDRVEADAALSDDSMPPLEHAGVQATSSLTADDTSKTRKDRADSEDSMPPLQYVGSSSLPAAEVENVRSPPGKGTASGTAKRETFRIGDVVSLKGLCTLLNGQVGVITKGTYSDGIRYPVKLRSSGKTVPVNFSNLEKLETKDIDDASDDSLPLLEALGGEPAATLVTGACSDLDTTRDSAESKESLGKRTDLEFRIGDAVTLVGLSRLDLNGTRAVVLTKLGANQPDRITVKVEKSGQQMSVKKDNLEHASVDAEVSDDSMPELDFVGPKSDVLISPPDTTKLKQHPKPHSDGCKTQSEPQANMQKEATLEDGAESDDSMPPLGDVGSVVSREANSQRKEHVVDQGAAKRNASLQNEKASPSSGSDLRVGDTVVLRDLADSRLNGQRAVVMSTTSPAHEDRCAIRVTSTGQKLAVKFEKIEKLSLDSTRASAGGCASAPSAKPISHDHRMSQSRSAADEDKNVTPPALSKEVHKKSGSSKPAQSKQVTPESLLERMREAMASNSERLISEVLVEVEGAKELRWGDLLAKKKQLMKKLRAKKRKFEGDGVSGVESELPTAGEIGFAEREFLKEMPKYDKRQVRPPPGDQSDGLSDMNWVVLNMGSLQAWCDSLKLPPEVLHRLQSEDVTSPSELAYVPEEDLKSFVKDLKMGQKARFLAAVQRMRQES